MNYLLYFASEADPRSYTSCSYEFENVEEAASFGLSLEHKHNHGQFLYTRSAHQILPKVGDVYFLKPSRATGQFRYRLADKFDAPFDHFKIGGPQRDRVRLMVDASGESGPKIVAAADLDGVFSVHFEKLFVKGPVRFSLRGDNLCLEAVQMEAGRAQTIAMAELPLISQGREMMEREEIAPASRLRSRLR